MTLDEALEFFSFYGNVSDNIEKMRKALPTLTLNQLRSAADCALHAYKQPQELIDKAVLAIFWRDR